MYHFGEEGFTSSTFNLMRNHILCPGGFKAVIIHKAAEAMETIVNDTKKLWKAASVSRLWLHINGHTDPDRLHDLPPWCVGDDDRIPMIDFVESISRITVCCKTELNCKASEILISMFGCELTRVSNGKSCKELFLSIPQSVVDVVLFVVAVLEWSPKNWYAGIFLSTIDNEI